MEHLSDEGDQSGYDSDVNDEELEIALYSQIHFEENIDLNESLDSPSQGFEFQVDGNYKSGFLASHNTSDIILNQSVIHNHGTPKDTTDHSKRDNLSIKKLSKKEDSLTDDTIEFIAITTGGHSSRKKKFKDSFNEPILIDSDNISDGDTDDTESMYAMIESDSESSGLLTNIVNNKRKKRSDPESDWKINATDASVSKRTPSRYYKPFRCLNCRETGHMSKYCPKPKKQVCGFCSNVGHIMRNCPMSLCYNCDDCGHDARECPQPRRQLYKACYRCDYQGHQQARCPDTWRQYHLTTRVGEPVKGKKRKKSKRIFCYNCAEIGHYGHECYEERMAHHVSINSPFVSRYSFSDKGKKVKNHVEVFPEDVEEEQVKKKMKTANIPKLSSYIPDSFIKGDGNNNSGRHNFDKMIKKKNKKNKKKNNAASQEGNGNIVIDLTLTESAKQTKKMKNKKKMKKKKKKQLNGGTDSQYKENKKSKSKCTPNC